MRDKKHLYMDHICHEVYPKPIDAKEWIKSRGFPYNNTQNVRQSCFVYIMIHLTVML
jgi:hypothetical protein